MYYVNESPKIFTQGLLASIVSQLSTASHRLH